MKAVKKYLAVMMSIFMIAGVMPSAVYASPEEGDVAEEVLMAEEAAPVPELDESAGPESVETVDDVSEVEAEAVIPEEPSAFDAGESSEEAPGLTTGESLEAAADEIENEVPEEIVGAGVQVGDGVTATFDPATGEVKFTSNGGTLWKDWISKSGFKSGEIKSIRSTGKLYLPADSNFLFGNLSNLTNLNTSYFDTTKVTNMMFMFYDCSSLTSLDLSRFDTSKVTNMFAMFAGCSSLTSLDLGSFNTANLTIISAMFLNCTNLSTLVLTNFDLSKVTSDYAVDVFRNCSALKLLKTPKKTSCLIDLPVTLYNRAGIEHTALPVLSSASLIFAKNKELAKGDLVLGDCVTGKFTSSTGALSFYSDEGTLWKGWKDVPGIDKSKIKSIGVSHGTVYLPSESSGMFQECSSLTNLDLSSFDTSNVTSMGGMFAHCSSLKNLDLRSFDTSNVTDMCGMFFDCNSLTNLDLSSFDTSNVTEMGSMFSGCESLINLYLSSFDTSNVTDMAFMFYGCKSLTNLDLSSFNTSNVTDMCGMFYDCYNLTNLDLSSFNTSNVTSMHSMFHGCNSLTNLDLSSFDTSNVTNMGYMFFECYNLTNLDLSSFNTSNVTDIYYMFYGCSSLTNLDLSSFDTSNVKSMYRMFEGCSNLTKLDLSSLDTSNVTDMYQMFSRCKSLTNLDLSSFNTSKVTNMTSMFNGCSRLTTLDLSSFDMSSVLYTDEMFDGCTKLQLLKTPKKIVAGETTLPATMYNSSGKSYAKMPVTSKSIVLRRTKKGFSDVQNPSHAYYMAIYWAAAEGITKGYSDGTFGINRNCTRGEMMMFLWRYAGQPSPKAASKSPFKDVPKTHTFYNAILWGSQKGITKGYSDGTFGINRSVTRGACMMFLWRLKGQPTPKAVSKSPFKDVPKTHAYYKAILWGAQKKVTTGYTSGAKKGTFGINENCTRGAIVTFLYRARVL